MIVMLSRRETSKAKPLVETKTLIASGRFAETLPADQHDEFW